MLQQQQGKLENRRKTDIAGFYAELRLLKDDLRCIIQQLYKVS